MMATAVARKRALFTYTWTIENVPVTNHINLNSPLFVAHSISREEWYIHVHLASYLWCTLVSEDAQQGRQSMIDIEFSLLAADGSQITSERNEEKNFLIPMVRKRDFLERISEFMPNNILTIQCRMWTKSFFPLKKSSDFCYARTRLETYTGSFLWPIAEFSALNSSTAEDFSKLALDERKVYPLKPSTPERPFLALILYLKRNSLSENVCVDFLISKDRNYSFCWEISVLDANGEVIASKMEVGRSYFRREITNYLVLISKNKLITSKNLFLPNDTLLLRCSFKIFAGVISSEIEYCTPNVSPVIKDDKKDSGKKLQPNGSFLFEEFLINEADENVSGDNCVEEKSDSEYCRDSCSLKAVLRHVYSEATLSDVSLWIATKLQHVPQEYPMVQKS